MRGSRRTVPPMPASSSNTVDSTLWKDRKVLLTGHTGFKGTWLAAWLTHLGAEAFNFGPPDEHTVGEVVQHLVSGWPGARYDAPSGEHPHEAARLHLDSRKAHHHLGWRPRFDFAQSLDHTLSFYRRWLDGAQPWGLMEEQIGLLAGKPV